MTGTLRAPDPTLAAHDDSVVVRYCGKAYRQPGELPVAHRAVYGELTSVEVDARAVCGDPGANLHLEADEAAYLAVACQVCFPHAQVPAAGDGLGWQAG